MKISNIYSSYDIYSNKSNPSKKTNASGVKNKDKFEVSNQAREFQLTHIEASKAPEVRIDKINDIKSRIDNGTYNVSSEDLASKILGQI